MRTLALCLMFLALSCEKKDNPITPPPPTINGKWDVVLTGTSSGNALMDFTESSGHVGCIFTFTSFNLNFSGTLSATGSLYMAAYDGTGRFVVTGQFTSDKKTLSGKMDLYDGATYLGYLTVAGTKR